MNPEFARVLDLHPMSVAQALPRAVHFFAKSRLHRYFPFASWLQRDAEYASGRVVAWSTDSRMGALLQGLHQVLGRTYYVPS